MAPPPPPPTRRCFAVTILCFTIALSIVFFRLSRTEEKFAETLQSLAFIVDSRSHAHSERFIGPLSAQIKEIQSQASGAVRHITELEKRLTAELEAETRRWSDHQHESNQQIDHVRAQLEKSSEELARLKQIAHNITADLKAGKFTQHLVAELAQVADDLGNVAFAISRLVELEDRPSNQRATAQEKRKVLNMARRIRECDFNCSGHGMSLNLAEVTQGCECVCVGGWTGAQCDRGPADWYVFAQSGTPKLHIPHQREELPPMNESALGCKNASRAYYLERYKTEEFRTDRALKFFWTLARHSFVPGCSSDKGQTIMIDIGANIGEQLGDWERELLNLTNCPRDDSLLILIEPNPQNVAVLRHKVAQRALKLQRENVTSAGRIFVSDSAVSYFDGVGRFAVNKKQARAGKGNERGSLDVNSATQSDATTTVFETRVERLCSILRSVTPSLVRPDNFTISLLKVDAEGYDPAVLYGAFDLLPRTNLVVFECHKLWHSAGFTFKDVAEFFAKSGFQTYKMGLMYWIPVTPPAYWDDIYDETLLWSNCIAVRNGHPFQHMFTLPPPCK